MGAGMDCASLERYLEAYLEGRLRRAQWLVLRRHVMTCSHCRARVEQLRQFEVELHGRFRAMARTQRLWTGLELDLVGQSAATNSSDGLPPKPARPPMTSFSTSLLAASARNDGPELPAPSEFGVREQRWPVLVLLCMVLAGVGTGGWLLVRPGLLAPGDVPASLQLLDDTARTDPTASYDQPSGDVPVLVDRGTPLLDPLDPSQADVAARDVDHWLAGQLGRSVDLALSSVMSVLGGRSLWIGTDRRPAVLVASEAAGRLLIFPTLDGTPSASADVAAFARAHGLHHTIRRQGGATFDILGSASAARLDEAFQSPASAD